MPILFGTLLLYELTARSSGQTVLSSLSRFRRCILASVVLTAAWALYLASAGSLSAFVDFFYVFAQGHDLEGAYATDWSFSHQPMITFMWVLPSVLWLITVWRVVAKLRRRSPWSIADWVMVAAAGISVIYFPKVLERADVGHVYEAFAVATPLFLLWIIELVKLVDRALGAAIRRLPQSAHLPRLRHPATGLIVIAILIGSATVPVTVASAVSNTPGNFHSYVRTDQVSTLPRMGYTVSGSVDLNQIRKLRAILNRYAGPGAPVFDYSNQPGILYYLLNRVPGTRFFHSEVVQTHLAQQEEINDLKASRPPIAIFSNTTFGLLSYDGIPQSVRSFEVSRYLFDHYTPYWMSKVSCSCYAMTSVHPRLRCQADCERQISTLTPRHARSVIFRTSSNCPTAWFQRLGHPSHHLDPSPPTSPRFKVGPSTRRRSHLARRFSLWSAAMWWPRPTPMLTVQTLRPPYTVRPQPIRLHG